MTAKLFQFIRSQTISQLPCDTNASTPNDMQQILNDTIQYYLVQQLNNTIPQKYCLNCQVSVKSSNIV